MWTYRFVFIFIFRGDDDKVSWPSHIHVFWATPEPVVCIHVTNLVVAIRKIILIIIIIMIMIIMMMIIIWLMRDNKGHLRHKGVGSGVALDHEISRPPVLSSSASSPWSFLSSALSLTSFDIKGLTWFHPLSCPFLLLHCKHSKRGMNRIYWSLWLHHLMNPIQDY